MKTPQQNLIEAFPDLANAYHYLKANDNHFKHILQQYEELDNKINHINSEEQPIEQMHFEEIKKQRLILKDQVHQYLVKNQSAISI